MLSRKEHAEICTGRNGETLKKLDEVLGTIAENRREGREERKAELEEAREHRERMYGNLKEIDTRLDTLATDVAVLKAQGRQRGRTGR